MLNLIQSKLIKYLSKAIKDKYEMELDENSISIEAPKLSDNGDYATNIAMQIAKTLKQNPRIVADQIVEQLINLPEIEKIVVASPGFINFFLKKEFFGTLLNDIINEKEKFGQAKHSNGISYNVEFVSANPTGDLHLGHARQAALGDSICRLLSAAGYKVTREYYLNDAGNQVHNLAKSLIARYNQIDNQNYPMPEDGYQGEDVIKIAQQLYSEYGRQFLGKEDEKTYDFFFKEGIKRELAKLQQDLLDFRVVFDIWSSETAIRNQGFVDRALQELKQRGLLYEKEEATWFKSTNYGDDKDRVVIKSDGSYTYFTPDIAYHIQKLDCGYDYLVDLLGADHHGYIPRMKAAIQALGHPANKLSIEIVQMVRLLRHGEEVKMSKRTGNAVSIRELCEEVGVDAVRYFFVARSASTHLDFELSLAKSRSNDNPVYYAQYVHARACQVIELARKNKIEMANKFEMLINAKESELIKHLIDLPTCIMDAAIQLSPYKLTNYIQKLAQLFHSFYNECKIVDLENLELSAQRLGLVEASRIVMKNALDLIGVSAPNRM